MDEKVEKDANIDTRKVQALAECICGLLKANGVEADDITQLVTDDIINNYSTVMNDRSTKGFDCGRLETVQAFMKDGYSIAQRYLLVNIDETSMISSDNRLTNDEGRYDIIWMTPERTREEYESIMGSIKERRNTNNIIDPMIVHRESIQRKKKALRRYIEEKGIEGIDTDIEPVEIDHDMVNSIADVLMKGFKYTDVDKREKILAYLENNWSEILGENQDIQFNEIHEAVFGSSIPNFDMIYLTDGMAYYSYSAAPKVIYATPEALNRTASATEKKISENFLSAYLSELRNANKKYAEEHGIKLDVFDSLKDRKSRDDGMNPPHKKMNGNPRGNKKGNDDLILPEDLKKRRKEYMSGYQEMLARLQAKIDSGKIPFGKKTKSLLSLHRTLCELKDKEATAKDLSQEYQKHLPEESRDER